MEKTKRSNYIDIAKGLGIILVVIGHIQYISTPLRYFIISFHMPMFFVISGMLFNIAHDEKKEAGRFIKGKLKRIMLPYFSFSIAYLILELFMYVVFRSGSLFQILLDLYTTICLHGLSVLWFLPSLFLGTIILFYTRRVFSHKMTIIFVIMLTLLSYILNLGLEKISEKFAFYAWFYLLHQFLVMILRSTLTVFYLTIGYYLKSLSDIIADRIKHVSKLIISISLIILVVFISQMNGAVDFHFLVFGNPIMFIFTSVAGSISIILFSSYVEKMSDSRICMAIRYYGKNSLTIMATHIDFYVLYFCITVTQIIASKLSISSNIIMCTMIVIFVFAVEKIVIDIINKFFPFFVGK